LFCRDTAHIKYLYDQAHAQLLPKYVSFLTWTNYHAWPWSK
jgi:hypothetical protein